MGPGHERTLAYLPACCSSLSLVLPFSFSFPSSLCLLVLGGCGMGVCIVCKDVGSCSLTPVRTLAKPFVPCCCLSSPGFLYPSCLLSLLSVSSLGIKDLWTWTIFFLLSIRVFLSCCVCLFSLSLYVYL